jgi:HlyD family secretion protein
MVEAEVYISDIARVAVGAPARIRGDGFDGEISGRVTEIIGQVGANALYAADPYSYSDRRIVKVRILLDDGDRVSGLSNSQVSVVIES